ncbi:MAG: AI-2E family transporter [Bacteroidetes bacterium]|nr:AI-2E family transporter [Bacteroidota bacterium]
MNLTEREYKPTSATVNIAALLVITAAVMAARSLVTPLLMSLFFSIIMAQPIFWLQKHKVSPGLGLPIVFGGVLILFFGFGGIIGESLSTFSNDAPLYGKKLNEIGLSIISYLNDRGFHFSEEQLTRLLDPSKIMVFTAGALSELGSLMGNMALIIFTVVFLLLEVNSFNLKARAIVKGPDESIGYLNKIGKSIRHYLAIKTMVSLLTGVLIYLGLLIIGVDYAILWAMIAFLLNYIPNFGSILAGIPAVLFALVQAGPVEALWALIVYITVNMVIGNVVEPKMMGQGMGLSTLVVFISLIFWGYVLGTVGMFLSVPLTMSLKIVFEENPRLQWIAVILGTTKDAEAVLDSKQNKINQ